MIERMSDACGQKHWNAVAEQWTAWARTPGHDVFWYYRTKLRTFIGPGNGTALEVGCGEGRVCRELKALGYHVTAADVVPALVDAAKDADSADRYQVADATDLPFAADSFDLVVAYNMLMDVREFDAALAEMARVVSRDGRIVVSLVHPYTDRGEFAEDSAEAPFVIADDYFEQRRFTGASDRDGLSMRWYGWSRPLHDYVASFATHGLAITDLAEPTPAGMQSSDNLARWTRLPLFLWMVLRPFPR